MNFEDLILKHGKSVVNSRDQCDTSAYLGKNVFKMPVMCSNMESVLNLDIVKIFDNKKMFYVYCRTHGIEDVLQFVRYANSNLRITSISVGITKEWINLVRLLKQLKLKVDYFTIDVALSYNDNVIEISNVIKTEFPDSFVIIGNGSTPEWVEWLGYLGYYDAFKMNIGVSKSCRTKEYTGYSNPTALSLAECARVNSNLKNPMTVISDGGLTVKNDVVWIGDIAKALRLGADWVMSGALFSRCIDSPSIINGYYGNASVQGKKEMRRVEGDIVEVKTNNLTIKEMIDRIQESLQSSISYSGGINIKELKSNAVFYQPSNMEIDYINYVNDLIVGVAQ